MKTLLTVFSLMLLLLTGCSTESSNTAMDGETIYNKSCAACHGDKLQGTVGPKLIGLKSKYSEDEVINIISKGTSQMPANLVSEEESKIVAKWLMKK